MMSEVNSAKKTAIKQAEQDPNLPCSASNVLFNRVGGQVEVSAG